MSVCSPGLIFGIHPFGVAGMASGIATGAKDDLRRLPAILQQLGGQRSLLLRTYIPFYNESSITAAGQILKLLEASGVSWDVVLSFRSDQADLTPWLKFIRLLVTGRGRFLNTLQITNEPNLRHAPDAGDGARPYVMDALREGIITAKQTARDCGSAVGIGFSAVVNQKSADDFWPAVKNFGQAFQTSLDYVGLDLYPDVFGPRIPLPHLAGVVCALLRQFRCADLCAANLPASIPIRISENGWPTGPDRSCDQQSQVLETIIRTVHRLRSELNITHYQLFGLRDADSLNQNLFYQFGIMRDDYTPKPAFETYRQLICELGTNGHDLPENRRSQFPGVPAANLPADTTTPTP